MLKFRSIEQVRRVFFYFHGTHNIPIWDFRQTNPILGYVKHDRYAANEEHLRRLLRNEREHRGLTQMALAAILNRPQSFVSKYESGERLLSFVETIDVCRVLGLEPS